jgi:hypothetical protein
MNRYTVVWVQSAESELVDIWTRADDRMVEVLRVRRL